MHVLFIIGTLIEMSLVLLYINIVIVVVVVVVAYDDDDAFLFAFPVWCDSV